MNVLLLALAVATAPKPIGNPSDWIRPDDYPKSENARGITGVTEFTLLVNAAGSVDECTVRITSGSETLDATACALVKVRARFTPARDGKGQKVSAIYQSRVQWRLPSDASITMPIQTQTMTIAVDQNTKGVVEACTVISRPQGLSERAPTPCVNFAVGRQLRPMTDSDGKPIKVRMTMTQSVTFAVR